MLGELVGGRAVALDLGAGVGAHLDVEVGAGDEQGRGRRGVAGCLVAGGLRGGGDGESEAERSDGLEAEEQGHAAVHVLSLAGAPRLSSARPGDQKQKGSRVHRSPTGPGGAVR
jgi:hypothetical protein